MHTHDKTRNGAQLVLKAMAKSKTSVLQLQKVLSGQVVTTTVIEDLTAGVALGVPRNMQSTTIVVEEAATVRQVVPALVCCIFSLGQNPFTNLLWLRVSS